MKKALLSFIYFFICIVPALPTPENAAGYGFDILKDKQPVVHQFQNPYAFSKKGIQTKIDAYKVAQWMINQFKTSGRWQNNVTQQPAQELKIETL